MKSEVKIRKIVSQVRKLGKTGARFASFEYTNQEGEKSLYTVLLGVNYRNCLRSSMLQLAKKAHTFSTQDILIARLIMRSLSRSVLFFDTRKVNPDYVNANTYNLLGNGLKTHKVNKTLYVSGIVVKKRVLKNGEVKKLTPQAQAKAKIRNALPIGKWRIFILNSEQLETVKISGKKI